MELDGRPPRTNELAALGLVNYGHFTTMRVEEGRVRGLSLHLERLARDCRAVFGTGLDTDRVRHLVRQAVGPAPGPLVTRVTVFDPVLDLGRPGAPAEPSVLVTVRPAAVTPLPPLRVASVPYRRDLPAVKHTGLFGALLQRRTAQQGGFDDALFTGDGGLVCEGVTWNIGFHDGEQVIWPAADCLPGVTMRLLQEAHPKSTTAPVRLGDLPGLGAAFATNTAIGVRAISVIDGTALDANDPIFDTLRREYAEVPAERL